MKCLGVLLLTLLAFLSVPTSAQDNPFSNSGQGWGSVVIPLPKRAPCLDYKMIVITPPSCPDYKMIIITPPSGVDFKMKVNTPSKNMDPGIVFKPCTESSQLAFGPQMMILPNPQQMIISNQEMSDYLKGILLLSGKKK